MSFIAIVGAGAIGGALAHRLASRGRVREVRLIDVADTIARGKALDIQQSSPIEGFSTRVSADGALESAAGAAAIVIADAAKGETEHGGETGLATLRRVAAVETAAPIILAGATQRWLLAHAVKEAHVDRRRLIGSAPLALESAVRALTALEIDTTGVEVQLRVVGVPPHASVVAWEEATIFGQPATTVVPAHRLAAIANRVPSLWPPGPFALSSAAARIAEAVADGSRRRFTCFVSIEEAPNRGAVVAMPAEIGPRGITRVLTPALTGQERTRLENGLSVS